MAALNPNQKLIEVNSSSIVDLKAELSRKQELFRQKNPGKDEAPLESDSNLYTKSFVNLSLPKRLRQNPESSEPTVNKRTKKESAPKETAEENQAIRESRQALERKTKLYDQMAKGLVSVDPDDENLLVNFDQKHQLMSDSDDPVDDDDEPVEYVDEFGRTRMVTPKELERLQRERAKEEEEEEIGPQIEDLDRSPRSDPQPDRRPPATNVHYQHVREGEVRDHGVAFYSFSENEETRAKQMEMLDKLRQETESTKREKQRIKEKRKEMIRNRLEKIAARKGLTLPPAEPDEPEGPPEPVITVERATLKPKPASRGPREWDLGKEGLHATNLPTKRPFYSQERYQEKMRTERNPEFAPPQIYYPSKNATVRKPPEPKSLEETDVDSFLAEIKRKF